MSRIRSLHPGQWTDEEFVACSMAARLLALALRNEADDNGVFEWKPLTIKMRCFPADSVVVADLLAELAAQDLIRQFQVGGKSYGAIKGFRRWQRPEKPKAWHPLPDSMRAYVGLSTNDPSPDEGNSPPSADRPPTDRQPVADQSPKVISEGRREEGGDKMEVEPPSEVVPPARDEPDECVVAVDAWNALASETGLPQVQRLTEPRRRSLKQRLAECGGIEGWNSALARIRGSPFLLGEGPKGWRADFDFVVQAKSFTKLMEGSYDGRNQDRTATDAAVRRAAIVAALGDELGAGGFDPGADAGRDDAWPGGGEIIDAPG